MSDLSPKPDFVRGTVDDLRGVIERLEGEMDSVMRQLSETRKRYDYWREFLEKIEGNGHAPRRARKGENAARILELFSHDPDRGFAMPDIAEAVGIPWSSVRNVVTSTHKDRFEEREGKYYLKRVETNNSSGAPPGV